MQIRYASKDDIPAIRAIYNAGIESGTGTFETKPRRNRDIADWLKVDNLYPLLVAESEGQVLALPGSINTAHGNAMPVLPNSLSIWLTRPAVRVSAPYYWASC